MQQNYLFKETLVKNIFVHLVYRAKGDRIGILFKVIWNCFDDIWGGDDAFAFRRGEKSVVKN